MTRRWPRLLGIAGAGVALAVGGSLYWALNTESGARWSIARAQGFLGGKLVVGTTRGTLAGPLTLEGLRYVDAEAGVDFSAARIRIDLAVMSLLNRSVHVKDAAAEGVLLKLTERTKPPDPDDKPFTLEAPIDLVVERLTLRDARVLQKDDELVDIRTASLAAAWTGATLAVRQLDVIAKQGEVHLAGEASGAKVYTGNVAGRFRWQAGERTYAGDLTANAADALADIAVSLSAPVTATLKLKLQQQDDLPWQFALELPAFDPRDSLLPDSSLANLAASLTGAGTLKEGRTSGSIELNREKLGIEALHFIRRDDAIDLDGLLRMGKGQVAIEGAVAAAATPVSAKLAIRWQDIVVPADLAGQVLNTRGNLRFDGSAERYAINGAVLLGPPRRMADIRVALVGTPQTLQVSQLDVVQPGGRLSAKGDVDLQPVVAWKMEATAQRFDPGAFAAAWPGQLDFSLQTDGRLEEAGPNAHVVLNQLRGTLRRRRVAGDADLTLGADKTLTGRLALESGASRINVNATRELTVANIDVTSLDDWLPQAQGALRAKINARGVWPKLAIDGTANGSALRIDTQHVDALQLEFDVANPLEPSGHAQLSAKGMSVAGFAFSTASLQAQGDQAHHTLAFEAKGDRLSTALALEGGRQEGGWAGTVDSLLLEAPEAARLKLQQPVRLSFIGGTLSASEACFVDGEIRLCFNGELHRDGALQAKYSIKDLPLKIANAFADLPVALQGAIGGEGDIQRDAAGHLNGAARLRSASGRIEQTVAEGDPERVLLAYTDLDLEAALNGTQASVKLGATLNESGALRGQLTASGLGEASTQLNGDVTANLPSIAVIEAFTTKVVNVKGEAALKATIAGTVDKPTFTGELSGTNLAADLPDLGLKLREGSLTVTPQGDGPIKLAGSIKSGEGVLTLSGDATNAGAVRAKLDGKDFLAADIPGVKVVVAPALAIDRDAKRVNITGKVVLSKADIDLQRLPAGDKARTASPDVVVVDDVVAKQDNTLALPITANIDIELTEQVKLAGYGIDATVQGGLNVREREGESTTASGELRVAGTYKAYGQDLTIQQGQLFYAATPIDNPRLAIVAVRKIDQVTAGLRINGSAKNPQLTVFSDPAMGQASALSYIVAGKPLDQIGQGNGESDALQTAARSLGTAAGGLLAKNVGKRLGVDELGIKESASLGGAALTVGQYLSPRLYLSYGVGLFEPGQVVTLRYKISSKVNLEAEQGPISSRAGVQYRMER